MPVLLENRIEMLRQAASIQRTEQPSFPSQPMEVE